MHDAILGIHHVTAIVGDPQRNVDFYAGVLGLRLVKRTVNFDDPETYHLYFGDEAGNPGSIMTFFPWGAGGRRGRQGRGQTAVTSFAVPPEAIGYWVERLVKRGVAFEGPTRRGDELVLSFRDHDGLMLEIVGHPGAAARSAWAGAGIPEEKALRGFHAVTLWEESSEATERVLVDTLGFRAVSESEGTRRYAAGDGGPGTIVDVRAVGGFLRGVDGVGAVHHGAFRVADDDAELAVRRRVIAADLSPTPVVDRQYFHSVYFREPGGVLFELATDPPGFTADEPLAELGSSLKLPERYEPMRERLERRLAPLHLPGSAITTPAGA